MARKPPDILITTPESLFLILTSQAREMLRTVETLILDEVHAVAGTKRGAHLALTVERLDELAAVACAAHRPLGDAAAAGGDRPLRLRRPADRARRRRACEGARPRGRRPGGGHARAAVQRRALVSTARRRAGDGCGDGARRPLHLAVDLPRDPAAGGAAPLDDRLRQQPPPGRAARAAPERAGGARAGASAPRLARARAARRGGGAAEEGRDPVPRRHLVARAGHRHGRGRPRHPGGVAQVRRARLAACRPGRATSWGPSPRAGSSRSSAATCSSPRSSPAACATARSRRPSSRAIRSTCSRSRSWRSVPRTRWPSTTCTISSAARIRSPTSRASSWRTCSTCSRAAIPSDEFAELRPRITWDRTGGTIRGLAGARRLAVTNAGTIPDRGLFTVQLADSGSKVGELDEEMVYEARAGQTFLLGASSWRIEEITRDRVLVSPAPGVPGAVPFWKGEGVGRPYELGQAIGRATRELVALSDEEALERLRTDYHLDQLAARNLLTFLREQEAATGAVPSDRTIVVERFRDEIGDWRVCVLTPFGGRVHAPWALALSARLHESLGLDAQSIWSDDGIALHLPDADAAPAVDELLLDPAGVEELVLAAVGESALFGSRFRENAARALLIPRRRPGERTPLWQQRLKAQSLLQVARRFPAFPIVLETYRECLQDVFDLQALRQLLSGIASRELDVVDVETPSASPFASSLLFDYVATYMFEDDTPPAERRAQALSLDRDLLRELLGQEELRDLLDADAVEDVERQLRGEPRNADDLHFLLLRRGDLRSDEYDQTLAEPLLEARRAVRVHVAGEERLIAAEDAGRYRDALGVMPPSGLPEAFLERDSPATALRQLVHDGRGGAGLSRRRRRTARFGSRRRADPARARGRRAARARRAATGRHRARVVRPGGAAAAAASFPGSAAQGSGAGRAGGVRAVSRLLARRRPALEPAGGTGAAAGSRAARLAVGVRAASPARARVPPRAARPAVRHGRGRLDRRRPRPRRRVLPRGRRCPGSRRRRAASRRRSPRRDTRSALPLGGVLVGPARGYGPRRGTGAACALGSRLGRRGDERRLAAAAGPAPLRDAEDRAATAPLRSSSGHGADRDPGTLVARGAALRRARCLAASAGGAAARASGDRDARRCPG